MKRRKWTPDQKTKIIFEGLKGTPVGEVCSKHQISQAQYYQWKEQFLTNASKAFEEKQNQKQGERLKRENSKLKEVVAELTLELKKSDEVFGW